MDKYHATLLILLLLSLAFNGLQCFQWNSYRSKPSGAHSHTGVMSAVTREQIERDKNNWEDG